jgi:hypothetical protein
VPFKLFGRRIRVRVGDRVICDLDPRVPESVNDQRNLDVQFSTQSHVKAEPLVTELTIYGLDKLTRDLLTANNDLARRIAWQSYQAVQVGDVLVDPENTDQVDQVTASLVSQGATVILEVGYDNDFTHGNPAAVGSRPSRPKTRGCRGPTRSSPKKSCRASHSST